MEIRPLTGAFGAEVLGVDLGSTSEPAGSGYTNGSGERCAGFREQDFDIDGFEKFAMNIGQFGDTPFITPLTATRTCCDSFAADEQGPLFGSGWHSDRAQLKPPSATLLYAVDVPEAGGDTAFTSQYLAFESPQNP